MTRFVRPSLTRRRLLQSGAVAAASAAVPVATPTGAQVSYLPVDVEELTLADARSAFESGEFTSVQLTQAYLDRILSLDQDGPSLNAVLEINPEALDIAARLDEERAAGNVRGPLHGIPVLLKDNIDTADQLHTTAGSLALMNSTPAADAPVVTKLRDAGAVILGKTNLSEWANMRGFHSSSGWSGRGGLTLNPYNLQRTGSGSSTGSAAAVSANLAMLALGTETNGSVVCPASACGVVGLKPTVGETSRVGVIPISDSQDTVGILGRTVTDTAQAFVLIRDESGQLPGATPEASPSASPVANPRPVSVEEYLQGVGLGGRRFGVPSNAGFTGYSPVADEIFAAALDVIRALGGEIVENADIPSMDELRESPGAWDRMQYEFKRDLNAYLETRNDPDISTLAELIAFNKEHAEEELRYFGQEIFELAQGFGEGETGEDWYNALNERLIKLSRAEGIDAALKNHNLDALLAPTLAPATSLDLVNGEQFMGASSDPSATAGYPIVNVTAGYAFGLPVGISFLGTAHQDMELLGFAYAFEQATLMRRPPRLNENGRGTVESLPRVELPGDGGPSATPEASPNATPIT